MNAGIISYLFVYISSVAMDMTEGWVEWVWDHLKSSKQNIRRKNC